MVKRAPQKGGKSSNSASSSKKPSTNTSIADDSFIVFSNSKDTPPKKSTQKDTGKTPAKDGVDLLGEPVKQPSVKQLIGGASWTGKLPVNMLSEHCQKQRWEKPEYTMVCSM
jgi:ATP-dependent RNA helicase DHX57